MSDELDAYAVKSILAKLPDVSFEEIEEALEWLSVQRVGALTDLNGELYETASQAIDCLLDARLVSMQQ